MIECEPLPEIQGAITAGDLLALLINAQSEYIKCRTIHKGLIDDILKREIKAP